METVIRFVKHWWAPLLVILFTVVGVCLTVQFWGWLRGEPSSGSQNPSATVRNVALVIAAPVALVLAVWRSIIAHEQADIARSSLRGERFQKAAEMLGSNLLSVRMGGIYGLCQLARDYPKELHLQVVNLLAAFVRYPPSREPPKEIAIILVARIVRQDIGEIMDFFFTRSIESRAIEKDQSYTIDLSMSDLSGVQFPPGSNLEGIDLRYTNLSGAFFAKVRGLTIEQLQGAKAEKDLPALFRDIYDSETGESLDELCDTVVNGRPRTASPRPTGK